jgi:hypothetical protein
MPRLRYRSASPPSRLEERFLMLWKLVKGPDLEREKNTASITSGVGGPILRKWKPVC